MNPRLTTLVLAALVPLAVLQAQSSYPAPYGFTTLAGSAGVPGSTDATASAARFNQPTSVAADSSGNVFVADSFNNTIRKITATGVATTLAGMVGSNGWLDGTGSTARFNHPTGVAVDAAGNVYVADYGNHTIRKITSAGVVTTLAGNVGSAGSNDGTGSAAQFNHPEGVAVDGSGNVYVADSNNETIRKITSAGVVTTLAGTASSTGSSDGSGSAARFFGPYGVAVDGSGSVYVADFGNHAIRKITSGGVVTTLAGSAGSTGSSDGTGSAARFFSPTGVAVDGWGNVYIADSGNHTVRKITSGGTATTLAGLALTPDAIDGAGSAARFFSPTGLAVDASGNVYVADFGNNTIRKGVPPAEAPIVVTQPVSQNVAGSYPVTFSAVVSGYPVPTYQWRKNGINIVGATGSSYTIASVGSGDDGNYTVVAKNSVGSVTSNVAALATFIAAPSNAVVSFTVE